MPGRAVGAYDHEAVMSHMKLIEKPEPIDSATIAAAQSQGVKDIPGTWRSLISGVLDVLVHGLLQQYYSRTVRDLAAEQLRIMAKLLGKSSVHALFASQLP